MARLLKKSLIFIVPIACMLVMSTAATAVDKTHLAMDYEGDFNYHSGSSSPVEDAYWLEFNRFKPTTIFYLNGDQSGKGGVAVDTMNGSKVSFVFYENFYNGNDQDADPGNSGWNYIFGDTNNSGAGGGGAPSRIDFEIKDTSSGEVFLFAKFANFEVTPEVCTITNVPFPPFQIENCVTRFNNELSMNSLWFLDVGPDYANSSSRYIQELGSLLNSNDGVVYNTEINMTFTFLSGSTDNDFIGDSHGTVQGKLVLLPEPVSSILFLTGGALLALRRQRRKIKKSKQDIKLTVKNKRI